MWLGTSRAATPSPKTSTREPEPATTTGRMTMARTAAAAESAAQRAQRRPTVP